VRYIPHSELLTKNLELMTGRDKQTPSLFHKTYLLSFHFGI